MNNEKALKAFMFEITTASELLKELQEYVNNHAGVHHDEVSWGHVGNVGYMVELLTELKDLALKQGEHEKR